MSYSSLFAQFTDQELMNRLASAVHKEAHNNPELAATDYATALKYGQTSPHQVFGWPLAVATEAAYEFALNSSNPSPGGDPAVITDADILASVQLNWPPDPWPPVSTP